MRYTVKGRSIYSFVFFVIALLSYVIYIYYDYENQKSFSKKGWWQKEFAVAKQDEAKKINLSALLLGGSNVAYSLSAQQLNSTTNYNWYNFGLSGEARTDLNYWNYISETMDLDKRLRIELVVYSSVALLRSGYLEKRYVETANAWGQRPIGLTPNIPLFEAIQNFNSKKRSRRRYYPLPKANGDFDFNRKKCPQKYREVFEREDDFLVAEAWIKSQLSEINFLFPNAKIVFVLPSEFYGNSYNQEFVLKYNKFITSVITRNFGDQVKVYFPSPYLSKNITCDNRHHGNVEGRLWRTNNLSEFIIANYE
jgi:hypothetical protein